MPKMMTVECGACGARSELPIADRARGGRCERCRANLEPLAEPLQSSAREFVRISQDVKMPVLAVFLRRACTYSGAMKGNLGSLAERFAGKAVILMLDADAEMETVHSLGLRMTPSFCLARTGRLLHSQDGWVDPSELARWLKASAHA